MCETSDTARRTQSSPPPLNLTAVWVHITRVSSGQTLLVRCHMVSVWLCVYLCSYCSAYTTSSLYSITPTPKSTHLSTPRRARELHFVLCLFRFVLLSLSHMHLLASSEHMPSLVAPCVATSLSPASNTVHTFSYQSIIYVPIHQCSKVWSNRSRQEYPMSLLLKRIFNLVRVTYFFRGPKGISSGHSDLRPWC